MLFKLHISTSPFNSFLGKVGFGFRQSRDRQFTGGQFAGDPSKGKLQAPAGGVTGASPHIVIKNNGIININLFIWV